MNCGRSEIEKFLTNILRAAGVERWTAMEGGFPMIVDGECIGGIGVSGGDWATDERIAQAAVEAIGATWKLDPK